MMSFARQIETPIVILASLMLALLLFATTGVSRAQAADTYNLASFSCGGGHNSGSYDTAGNLYIPCSDVNDPNINPNSGSADPGAASYIRVLKPDGTPLKKITIPQNTDLDKANDIFISDVAPNADGTVLYFASGIFGQPEEQHFPVRKMTVNGTSGTVSNFAPNNTAWKIATDKHGYVYIADFDNGKIFKLNSEGIVMTSFAAPGRIGSVAVNAEGTQVYTVQQNGAPGTPNMVHRFDRPAAGTTYTQVAAEAIGGNYQGDCYSGENTAAGSTAGWIGYFSYAWDVGLDGSGNIYVLNTSCHEVLKFNPQGKGFNTGMKINMDDPAKYAAGGKPHGMAVARNGDVFIGEANAKMDLPDATAPTASITGGPAQGSTDADATPTFSFTSNPVGATFQCKFDNEAYAGCVSPLTRANALPAGQHTFSVKATKDGLTGPETTRTWTVGDVPPGTCKGEANTMTGGDAPDSLAGRAGLRDVIGARGGADTIRNLDNTDVACGGAGYDTFTRFSGSVQIDGAGDGTADDSSDVVDFSWITEPNADVNGRGAYVALGGISDGVGFEVTTSNVSDAVGSSFPDSMYGDSMRNTLEGGAGNDFIVGGAEAAGALGDNISGEAGSDTIKVRDGSKDTVFCGESADDFDTVEADALDVVASDCERVLRPDTIRPTVNPLSPRHGSILRDTTPTIKATVRDNLTNLGKANIKLYVNNVLISPTKYAYNASTDLLTYNSPRLSLGKKTVKVVATDAARNVGTKSWSFTIR